MRADTGKRWTCLVCGEGIKRRHLGTSVPVSEMGKPFYEHTEDVILSSHDAVRAPEESDAGVH